MANTGAWRGQAIARPEGLIGLGRCRVHQRGRAVSGLHAKLV